MLISNAVTSNMHIAFDRGLWFWLPSGRMVQDIARRTVGSPISNVSLFLLLCGRFVQFAESPIALWQCECLSISFGGNAWHGECAHPPQAARPRG